MLAEVDNDRIHLLTFITIAQPSRFERWLIQAAQGASFNAFFLLYLFSPKTARRLVGYFEECQSSCKRDPFRGEIGT